DQGTVGSAEAGEREGVGAASEDDGGGFVGGIVVLEKTGHFAAGDAGPDAGGLQVACTDAGNDADTGGDEALGSAGGSVEDFSAAAFAEFRDDCGGAAAVEIQGVVGVH